MSRRAKQKGLELLNYGKNRRNDKRGVKDNEKPKDCVICLDVVDVRGLIICAHWFCFECIYEWSKKTNTCPLCKQRFRCITKISIGNGDDSSPQKVRIKDKNQNNISFAEDDYAVAMGLLSESSDTEVNGDDDLDETFEPPVNVVERSSRFSSNIWSARTRQSTQDASIRTMDNFFLERAVNRPGSDQRENKEQRVIRRRQARDIENSPQWTRGTSSSTSSMMITTPQSVSDEESIESNIHNSPLEVNYSVTGENEKEEDDGENSENNGGNIKDDRESTSEEEEEEEEEEVMVITQPKKRKKRKTIVFNPKKHQKSGRWIDMSDKSSVGISRQNLRSTSCTRASISRSAKRKSIEKMREQRHILDTSITSLIKEQDTGQSTKRSSRYKRLRLASDSSVENDMITTRSQFSSKGSSSIKQNQQRTSLEYDKSCSSTKQQKSAVKANSCRIYFDSDDDADADIVLEQAARNSVSHGKTRKTYSFRKMKRKNYQVPSPFLDDKEKRVLESTSGKCCSKPDNVSPDLVAETDYESDETCYLNSNDNEQSSCTFSTPHQKRDEPINLGDVNISLRSSLGVCDEEISPCVLSQLSTQPSLYKQGKKIQFTPKKISTKKASENIETTPINCDSDYLAQSPCLFEEDKRSEKSVQVNSTSGKNTTTTSYTFKKFRRKFRHYSPSVPLKNIRNISMNSDSILTTP